MPDHFLFSHDPCPFRFISQLSTHAVNACFSYHLREKKIWIDIFWKNVFELLQTQWGLYTWGSLSGAYNYGSDPLNVTVANAKSYNLSIISFTYIQPRARRPMCHCVACLNLFKTLLVYIIYQLFDFNYQQFVQWTN